MLYSDDLDLKFQNYVDIKKKIRREIQAGQLIPVARGLYESERNISGKYLAGRISVRRICLSNMPCPFIYLFRKPFIEPLLLRLFKRGGRKNITMLSALFKSLESGIFHGYKQRFTGC